MPYTLKLPTAENTADPSGKPYTAYHLTLSTPLRTQVLPKRYSDFVALDAALRSSTGAAPPAPLPGKSWFTRTVNSPELTAERRKGLEAYLRAIEDDKDPKWRSCGAYRAFLGFSTAPGEGDNRRRSAIEEEALGPEARPSLSSHAWLDLHHELKDAIQSARLALTRRDQATAVSVQHESGAQAKKSLVKANTLLLRLDEGLKGLAEGKHGREKLGDGELRRRRDLLSKARKERAGLEGVLNSYVATRSQARSPSPPASISSSVPGSFPSASGSAFVGGGRRVLGGAVKETQRTRELDNAGVLQLQQQIMQEQDLDVQDLAAVVRRMKEVGITINEELVDQGQLLDVVDQDVERVEGKIGVARKRVKKIR